MTESTPGQGERVRRLTRLRGRGVDDLDPAAGRVLLRQRELHGLRPAVQEEQERVALHRPPARVIVAVRDRRAVRSLLLRHPLR
jgi:hypothetical protein